METIDARNDSFKLISLSCFHPDARAETASTAPPAGPHALPGGLSATAPADPATSAPSLSARPRGEPGRESLKPVPPAASCSRPQEVSLPRAEEEDETDDADFGLPMQRLLRERFEADEDESEDGKTECRGEVKLAIGVMWQALSDLSVALRRRRGESKRGYGNLGEVWDWFFDEKASRQRVYPLELACDTLGLDPAAVRRYVARMVERQRAGGTAVGKRTLSPEEVDAIRDALEAGESTTRLARRYSVDDSTIRKIRSRRLWPMSELKRTLPHALKAVEQTLARGRKAHRPGEWREEGIRGNLDHALRHLEAADAGDPSEPHLIHAACRILMAFELANDRGPARAPENPKHANQSDTPATLASSDGAGAARAPAS